MCPQQKAVQPDKRSCPRITAPVVTFRTLPMGLRRVSRTETQKIGLRRVASANSSHASAILTASGHGTLRSWPPRQQRVGPGASGASEATRQWHACRAASPGVDASGTQAVHRGGGRMAAQEAAAAAAATTAVRQVWQGSLRGTRHITQLFLEVQVSRARPASAR